jgi:hypothetical protein
MKDFQKVSPLRILEKSARRGLGRGNLGVLVARAGGGRRRVSSMSHSTSSSGRRG